MLSELISKRTIEKLLMELRITTNPHLEEAESKKLIEELVESRQALWGVEENTEPLDKEAFELLRSRLQKTSQSITVK